VGISLRGFGRKRTVVSVAGSVAAHLLLLAVLVWVKPPATVMTVKRGEPIFVELPEADERAQRGLAAARPPERPKALETPPAAPPAPAQPAPPAVAKAAPVPEPATPPAPPAPPEASAPAPPPAVQAPAPAGPPKESPRETPTAAAPKVAAVPPAPREPVPDIRSLSRGPGGAGGSGEGWAGIEGDPIPLDTKDNRYSDYLLRVRRMITAKWVYPCVRNASTSECEYKSAKLVIVFGILKDGRVPRVDVAEHSNYEIYDDVAVRAIQLASPFPPVPAELMTAAPAGSAGIRIVASFHYILESSLTNILR